LNEFIETHPKHLFTMDTGFMPNMRTVISVGLAVQLCTYASAVKIIITWL
jgi:hypothetical protein